MALVDHRLCRMAGDDGEVQPVFAVGALGIGAHRPVEGVGVVADEDPPTPGASREDALNALSQAAVHNVAPERRSSPLVGAHRTARRCVRPQPLKVEHARRAAGISGASLVIETGEMRADTAAGSDG